MANCQVCGRPDTGNMAPCCKCGSWLHFECIDISSSIVMADQSVICPCCLASANPKPLVPEKKKHEKVKSSKASSVRSGASSVRSATGVRTRLAELKLKKLEEQKKLALQRLELEDKLREAELAAQKQQQEAERAVKKQQQEAELAAMKLQVESEALEETFRLMEEIERAGEEDDGKSVASEQSSRSKVTQWQKQQFLSSTRVGPAETAAGTGQQGRNPTKSGANTSAVERPAVGKPGVNVKSARGSEQQTDTGLQTGLPPPPEGNPQPVPSGSQTECASVCRDLANLSPSSPPAFLNPVRA
ncbi:conserved hypothetical protein [Culex quinquefasciatus]|uniref:PHD-type domain-containing protein n=1 Tax=Culex quinquefasciatus TaxID=7176 RepID=B0WR08_CULQU|nr:conserved hypothetical protein [Culex quinquefasciatus]|eukprot:XP_001851142.1 conserved hypothetical protein [Culex quinquefasciatus]